MKNINTSFWESEQFKTEFLIVGAGFLGSWTAYELKKKHPKAKVTVIDKDTVSYGASIRNAGFACFGSITEILSDCAKYGQTNAYNLVESRYKGIEKIKSIFDSVSFEPCGGLELLDASLVENSLNKLPEVNYYMSCLTNDEATFTQMNSHKIFNKYEGLLDSYKLLSGLHDLCKSLGVNFIHGVNVEEIYSNLSNVEVYADTVDRKIIFKSKKVIVCANATTKNIAINDKYINIVSPQRNHVLVTSPIEFDFNCGVHAMEGYIYFRPLYIENKKHLLIGGARHIDFEKENTLDSTPNKAIISYLNNFIKTNITQQKYNIIHNWTGFMGFTKDKQNVSYHASHNVLVASSCNGMGVAMCPVFAQEIVQQY